MTTDREAERAEIVAWLLRCATEMDRQRLNMLAGGHKMTARMCGAESLSYRNAASMIERGDHQKGSDNG